MSLSITPKLDFLGAEIGGLDLRNVPPPDVYAEIHDALYKYSVLIFPDQELSPEQHIAFSRGFGELHSDPERLKKGMAFGELSVFGNLDGLGDNFTPPDATADLEEWHSDHSHMETAALVSLLYALAVPDIGGDTMFASMTAAYEAAPRELLDKVEGRFGIHTAAALVAWRHEVDPLAPPLTPEEEATFPTVERPLVHTHPKTGKKAFYFGSKIMRGISGQSQEESRALIDELTAFATQRRFVYSHHWRKGELVIWDNRAVLHTGTHYDRRKYGRLMQRTTVLDTPLAAA